MATIYLNPDHVNDGDGDGTADQTGAGGAWNTYDGKSFSADDVVKIKRGTRHISSTQRTVGQNVLWTTYYNDVDGSDDAAQPRPILESNVSNGYGFRVEVAGAAFENLEITSTLTPNGSTDQVAGIFFRDSAATWSISNCAIHHFRYGIRATTTVDCDSCLIENCTLYDMYEDGIYLQRMTNSEISNCTVYDVAQGADGDCIQIASDGTNPSYANHVHDCTLTVSTFTKQHLIMNNGVGISTTGTSVVENNQFLGTNGGCYMSTDVIIRNNLFSSPGYSVYCDDHSEVFTYDISGNISIGRGDSGEAGVTAHDTSVVTLYNNYFTNYGEAFACESTATLTAKNNIVELAEAGDLAVVLDSGATAAVDYNSYYPEQTAMFNNAGTTYDTLSAWQAATVHDDNSLSSDPALTTDYKPTVDSPCIEAGTVANQFARDYNGRPFRKPATIGAYEVTSGFPAQTRTTRT